MLNTNDILETIQMITDEHLDVRTVTMGISLLDCADPDGRKACEKIYRKITEKAKDLVKTAEDISATYGMPIVNKRISVTPIAMLLASAPDADPVWYAKTLDAAAKAVGVNFIGGYSALVHKGFSAGDERLIRSIPEALACTDYVCSSINVGSTKSGINMDAVKMMGPVIKEAAARTRDKMCAGAAKLVVFCNAPEDNPFMAGAFHGPGEPDCVIHVGVSGPGAGRAALAQTCALPISAGRALRHRGPFTCAHARARRFRGEYSGGDRAGELRLLRHDGHAGHAERRGKKGRRDGLEPRWRAFRRVHPCVRGRRHDQSRGARQPIH